MKCSMDIGNYDDVDPVQLDTELLLNVMKDSMGSHPFTDMPSDGSYLILDFLESLVKNRAARFL